ncbi:hypothetical protein N7486_008424 [Penicillium sp. IBT 16267x]|nr:hypothetical protein N7486_008424 [Penicillium sp. IBT 16267x]
MMASAPKCSGDPLDDLIDQGSKKNMPPFKSADESTLFHKSQEMDGIERSCDLSPHDNLDDLALFSKKVPMQLQSQSSVESPMLSDNTVQDLRNALSESVLQEKKRHKTKKKDKTRKRDQTRKRHKTEGKAQSSDVAYLRSRLQYWKRKAKSARDALKREVARSCKKAT